ncbi:MAG TPA: tetratricopeptide repeat protein [Candidatus Polarisedimenticolaceae bacterium]
MIRRLPACTLALLLLAPARADRLHLESGGVIVADVWRIEGDSIVIESEGGITTLPRSLVVRIERAGAAPPQPKPPKAAAPRPAVASDRAGLAAWIEEGSDALDAREFERATRAFGRALDLEPRLTAARIGLALAEMALGRDARALAVVLDGLARDPSCAELHELLGDLRNREERVEDARASWTEAFRLSPNDRVRDKLLKAERELHAGKDYAFAAAANFNIRYDGEVDPELAAEVAEFLEERLREMTSLWSHAPEQAITVVLYPKQAFHEVTLAGGEVGGLFDGKIRVPIGGLKRLDPRAQALLSHELTHAVVHSKSRGQAPRWLHEGLAQIAEPRPFTRADREAVRRALGSGDPATWAERAFSYPAALSLVRHLESERGFDALVRVVGDLGEGKPLDEALRGEYGVDYVEACRAWAASLAREEDR